MCELCGGGDSVGVLRGTVVSDYVVAGGVCFGALCDLGSGFVSALLYGVGGV